VNCRIFPGSDPRHPKDVEGVVGDEAVRFSPVLPANPSLLAAPPEVMGAIERLGRDVAAFRCPDHEHGHDISTFATPASLTTFGVSESSATSTMPARTEKTSACSPRRSTRGGSFSIGS
jgi:hypothetical protein